MTNKTWIVLAFVFTGLISGLISQYFYPDNDYPPSDLWLMPIYVGLVFLWYRLDSDERLYQRSVWLNVSIIAISVIALPYYLFRSRGAKHGFIATCIALLVYAAGIVATVIGQLTIYYGIQI